jgi:alpha-1,3-rhamnosyl/mannosyltransferase
VQAFAVADDVASMWAATNDGDRQRVVARAVRYAWRRIPTPWRRSRSAQTIEILFWRGRFRFRTARRVAIVQDLTTIVHPELHTPGNVAEFDEFLRYVHRHATEVWTISAHSRADIVNKTRLCPSRVSVMSMSVHPRYISPEVELGVLALHSISAPYVIAVGTVEPRKNLRRFVRACELLRKEPSFSGCAIVIAGPRGWDDGFAEFVQNSEVAARVRLLGFVPGEHLPSLYHFAEAVIYPSVYEGFGLPVLEAMCSSAVVLTSRSSSLPEVLGDDEWLFDPYDTEDIARLLLRAVELPPADRDECRRRSRQRAESRLVSPMPAAFV